MDEYDASGRWSAVQCVAILLAARPRWVWCALADRRSRVALAVADVADAATGGTGGGPESWGLLALARHGDDPAAAVDWLAGYHSLPARVVGSLVDAGAMVVHRPAPRLWARVAQAEPQVLAQVRAELRCRPRRAVLLALAVADLTEPLPDRRQQAAAATDPLLPALRAGARRYLRRRSTEDAVAGIGGIVAAG